jgi:hypothetical protein
MCLNQHKVLNYCVCLENSRHPTSHQILLLEHYIPLFKLYLRFGPHPNIVRYISINNLMVLLDFFSKQGNFIRFQS